MKESKLLKKVSIQLSSAKKSNWKRENEAREKTCETHLEMKQIDSELENKKLEVESKRLEVGKIKLKELEKMKTRQYDFISITEDSTYTFEDQNFN